MPLFFAIPFEFILMFIVFACISRLDFKPIKIILIIMLIGLLLTHLLPVIPVHNLRALVGNVTFIIFTAMAAYIKIKSFKLSAFFAMFSNIVYMLAALITNTIMYPILSTLVGNVGYEVIMAEWIIFFIYNFSVFTLAFIFASKAGIVFQKRLVLLDEGMKETFANYLFIGALITLTSFFIIIYLRDTISNVAGYPLAYTLSLAVCFALLIFLMISFEISLRKEMDLRYKNESLSNLREYIANIEDIRKFKHDHGNLMLGFFEHIKNKDINKINEYYQKYISSFYKNTDSINTNIEALDGLSSPEIKSILAYKLSHAQQLGIDVFIDVSEKSNPIDDNLIDVCRIIGTLIENAIDACKNVEGALIRFGALNKGQLTLFVVENTCHEPPDLEIINEAGYTTKGEKRGLGLHTTSQIIQRNPNLTMATRIEDGLFIQILSVA
ncbi:MAG: GHKL domain-containing protein [Defluviitaleaceae bacterium]|nr:GHKL domain-containing protein [Defluviitaleaceae bacterium]